MDLGRWAPTRALARSCIGALLVLAGVGLMAMTARGLLNYREAAARHGGEVIDLDADAGPQAGQHGFMARVVGTPVVVEAPTDPEFNLHVSTPVLVRNVEMFQWREVRIGADVHYEQDWVGRLLDASHFERPAGHANPGSFPLSSKQFDAGLVQLGGFALSPQVMHALPSSTQATPDLKALPANLAASFSQYQNYLVTSATPGDPRVGDVRVSWNEVPLQQVTIVARVDGGRLVAATDTADGKGLDVEVGDAPLLDIFPDLPVPPGFVLIRQVLAVLLAALGALLLLPAYGVRRDPLLALAVGALAVGLVASVLWLGNDSQAMGYWLLVTLLGAGVAFWRWKQLQRRQPDND
ncbi:MAG: TMEM43 family protein [Rhodanobacter sp.]